MTGSAPRHTAYLPFLALAFLALVWGYNWVVMKVAVRAILTVRGLLLTRRAS